MGKNDEHQFESDIEAVMTGELGWQKATERGYLKWRDKAFDLERLVDFVKAIQQLQWRAFERAGTDRCPAQRLSCGRKEVLRRGVPSREPAERDVERIIVSTLQKFPVIFRDVKSVEGKRFAIIIDEAHSSQTGDSAAKMKYALADLREAIAAYEAETGKTIDKEDADNPDTQLALLMCAHGKQPNLSYFAFTAT